MLTGDLEDAVQQQPPPQQQCLPPITPPLLPQQREGDRQQHSPALLYKSPREVGSVRLSLELISGQKVQYIV